MSIAKNIKKKIMYMTLCFKFFAKLFMYRKKQVKIALKYFAKLFFIGLFMELFIWFNLKAFHRAEGGKNLKYSKITIKNLFVKKIIIL